MEELLPLEERNVSAVDEIGEQIGETMEHVKI